MFNSNIPFYSISIVFALIANIITVMCTYKKYNYNKDEIICLLLYENIGIILGAKYMSYLMAPKNSFTEYNLLNLGLNSYGAVCGAACFVLLFCILFKKSLKETIFILAPSFPLMYSIGKIGCFITGCCYGIEYDGIFKVMYKYSAEAPSNVYLFPVQLLESVVFLIIFIYLISKQIKNEFNMKLFSISVIICSLAKFFLEYLRMNNTGFNQYLSIVFMLFGIFLLIYQNRLAKKE